MKQLAKTKATVRLRKAEDKNEWYVYIESYPVEVSGKKTPHIAFHYKRYQFHGIAATC